jgi:hypothetical protein
MEMNERKSLTVNFHAPCFLICLMNFFSQITAGFGCRLCDRKRAFEYKQDSHIQWREWSTQMLGGS